MSEKPIRSFDDLEDWAKQVPDSWTDEMKEAFAGLAETERRNRLHMQREIARHTSQENSRRAKPGEPRGQRETTLSLNDEVERLLNKYERTNHPQSEWAGMIQRDLANLEIDPITIHLQSVRRVIRKIRASRKKASR